MGRAILVAIALLTDFATSPSAAPSLRDVLTRAGDYVARYHEAMTSVIAEERYVQKWTELAAVAPMAAKERTLVSDFVLLSGGPGEPRWMSFRDVLAVDGVPVRSATIGCRSSSPLAATPSIARWR